MKKMLFTLCTICFLATSSASAKNANAIVVPKPNSVIMKTGSISLGKSISIKQTKASKISSYFKAELEKQFDVIVSSKKSDKEISIIVDKNSKILSEGYLLDIQNNGVTITASTETGAFYGVQSLLQLMKAGKKGDIINLSCQLVEDAPRFSWRSYMLDESRYFLGKEEVLRLLDVMAELKMNVFHWHLTDDAGWRIEIKKYPLLTEIGSKRKDTEIETWGSGKTSGVPHEGFYTQKQIKEILAYAKQRHIKVVPEIEMPGHASAAIASYPWLGTKNETIEVPVKFGKLYHTYDVIDPRVEKFLKDVVTEVIDLFDTDVIHIGGDEVRFDHWEQDADMVAHKKAKGFSSFMDIQIEFTNNMSTFIASKGCSMMGWNEILGKNLHADDNIEFDDTSTKLASNVVVHFWKGDLKELSSAAEQGYRLVNSYHGATYLDYSHESIPLKKAYEFDPIPEGLSKEYEKNIIGSGCQMWREWAPTVARVQEQTFPRIAAYAEVGWSEKSQKNYDCFAARLKPIVAAWKSNGIVVYPSL